MTVLRNIAFVLAFYGLSIPIVLFAPIPALLGQPALIGYAKAWMAFHRWCTRWLLGIRVRYEGPELPFQPAPRFGGRKKILFG